MITALSLMVFSDVVELLDWQKSLDRSCMSYVLKLQQSTIYVPYVIVFTDF